LIKKPRWRTADARTSPWSILKATQQGTGPVRFGCRWGAYWRNLANTTEPSVYVGDAALCQITLTTCFSIQTVYKHCLARTIRLKVLKSISLKRYYVKNIHRTLCWAGPTAQNLSCGTKQSLRCCRVRQCRVSLVKRFRSCRKVKDYVQ